MKTLMILAAGSLALAVSGCANQVGSVYKAGTPTAAMEQDAVACGASAYAPETGVTLESGDAESFRECMQARGYSVRTS